VKCGGGVKLAQLASPSAAALHSQSEGEPSSKD
jgi:hypothetical protein